MRKFVIIFALLFLLLSLCGCLAAKTPIESLPSYETKVLYSEGNYQSFADYAKYIYKDLELSCFEEGGYFSAVTEESEAEIAAFAENFGSLENTPDGYDFDTALINEGDYFYIETLEDSEYYDKLDNYTVYFFDAETSVLYYLHKNI